jgi:hypothetical protein
MHGEVHCNRPLYKTDPEPGHRYRQITVVEFNTKFLLRIHEGDVILTEPEFKSHSTDAETYFHNTLKEALSDADGELQRGTAEGWIPYSPVPR